MRNERRHRESRFTAHQRALDVDPQPVTDREDIASVAAQLADLTRHVEAIEKQLTADRARADTQQERANTQQERIDLAARELAEVSERLQAAANALRESI